MPPLRVSTRCNTPATLSGSNFLEPEKAYPVEFVQTKPIIAGDHIKHYKRSPLETLAAQKAEQVESQRLGQ